MSGGQLTAVLIVAIVMIAGVIKSRHGHQGRTRDREVDPRDEAETLRLREEVKMLKERLHVLERITVEKENTLAKQIEELRDR